MSKKISALPDATLPLDGTELIPLVQGGVTKKTAKSNIGGTATLQEDILYAALVVKINAGTLTKGVLYKITDRGDRGLFFTAISTTQLSKDGTRLMLCPARYSANETDGSGNIWKGVWNTGKTVVANNLCIWGGKVWKNLTGTIGTAVDDTALDAVNWVLIPKTSFTNNEYIVKEFGCQYDVINDWIEKQWDSAGNIFGIDYNTEQFLDNGFNLCDISDWNYSTNNTGFVLFDNVTMGVWNNSCRSIYSNKVAEGIFNNSNNGDIYENYSSGIFNNSNNGAIRTNQGGDISENRNTGEIGANVNSGIDGNTNGGAISSNYSAGTISTNSNTGEITGNSNAGDVYLNGSNVTIISHNRNGGGITSNNNVGIISNNVNSGLISNNTNVGDIYLNANLGTIISNSNNGEIEANWNAGEIDSNTNGGEISLNGNLWYINQNANTGYIKYNNNNGGIFAIGAANANIVNNSNNGSIVTTTTGDISDPIVNK